MKTTASMLVVLALSATVSAQVLQIEQRNLNLSDDGKTFRYPNDHPNKLQYDDPSQWPCIDPQGHWGAPGVNPMFTTINDLKRHITTPDGFGVDLGAVTRIMVDMPSHQHEGPFCFPLYAKIPAGTTLTFPFTMQVRHLAGIVGGLSFRLHNQPIVPDRLAWKQEDGTYADVPRALSVEAAITPGDPHTLIQVQGLVTVTFVPAASADGPPALGWSDFQIEETGRFTNTDTNMVIARLPYYAVNDPTATESMGGPLLQVESRPFSELIPNLPSSVFGGTFDACLCFIPLAPITTAWTIPWFNSGYGGSLSDPSELIVLRNNDFHHDVFGTVLADVFSNKTGAHNTSTPFTIDPFVMCAETPPVPLLPGQARYTPISVQSDGDFSVSTSLLGLVFTADCAHLGDEQTVAVPNILGDTEADARMAILSAGLEVGEVLHANSDTVDAGHVLSQTLPADAQVALNSVVGFTVSLGKVIVQQEVFTTVCTTTTDFQTGTQGHVKSLTRSTCP